MIPLQNSVIQLITCTRLQICVFELFISVSVSIAESFRYFLGRQHYEAFSIAIYYFLVSFVNHIPRAVESSVRISKLKATVSGLFQLVNKTASVFFPPNTNSCCIRIRNPLTSAVTYQFCSHWERGNSMPILLHITYTFHNIESNTQLCDMLAVIVNFVSSILAFCNNTQVETQLRIIFTIDNGT